VELPGTAETSVGLPEGYNTRIYQNVNKKMHALAAYILTGLGRNVLRPLQGGQMASLAEVEAWCLGCRSLLRCVDGVGGDMRRFRWRHWGQRISTESIFAAAPRPKWRRRSFLREIACNRRGLR